MAAYKSPPGATEKLLAHLKQYGKDRSWDDLTLLFNPKGKGEWARSMARIKGFNTTTNQFQVQEKIEYTEYKQKATVQKEENSKLIKKVIELQRDLRFLDAFKKHTSTKFVIPPPTGKANHEATPIIQWSDWHVDEVVKPSTVNGFNEFNPEICEARAKNLFSNTIKLINTQRTGVIIKRLVLHLGGDIVTAWIHPEGMQTNSMTPQQGVFFAFDLHRAGIQYLLKHGEFEQIYIVCSRGNHGRVTHKMQYGNDYSTNSENYMYKMLANEFKSEKRVVFQIDDAELAYMNIYGKQLRFFHGWQIRFQGGIGGLTIPLYKALHRWNANVPTYYNLMCDKHTYSSPTPDCTLNGSLIGFNAYALSNGFSFQPPLQSFTLLDSKRGITIKAPLFCQEK